MSSREAILAAVKRNQPALLPLPEKEYTSAAAGDVQKFSATLESIGGKAYLLNPGEDVLGIIATLFPEAKRVVSVDVSMTVHYLHEHENVIHHSLQDVDVAIIKAQFGVAENGAVWVTEEELKIRVMPFICEHLVAIVDAKDIVPNMHEAYNRIGLAEYSFGVFIAGPSKTADIEQSLVLGAHGPKSMTVLIK
jgi:L-lactate dehydrogenase complex protein LldG